jgi:hypothetical protein
MRVSIGRVVVRFAIACVVLMASFTIARSQDNTTAAKAEGEHERSEKFVLQFNAASGSIATGAPINRTDNLRMEALVRYDGPSANGGVLIYNGNGCCNGWGLLVYGTNPDPNAAGRLAILAGGIVVQDSQQSLTLPVGVWQRIRVESRGQLVTLSFPGNDAGPVFSFGVVPRNDLNFEVPSSVTVGQGFNGLIKDVRFTSLDTPNTVLEFWRLNEGAGNIATGVNGAVLNLTNTSWAQLSRDDDNSDK